MRVSDKRVRVGKTLRDRNSGQGVNKVMNCLHRYQVREENVLQTERRHSIERESITAIAERRVTSPGNVLCCMEWMNLEMVS